VGRWGGGGGGGGGGEYVDHSSLSSWEVMNECSYTATIPVCYSGMDKNDFYIFRRVRIVADSTD